MKKTLFLVHDCTRTGAPIVLLLFLEWLKKTYGEKIFIVSLDGGALRQRFEKVSDDYFCLADFDKEESRLSYLLGKSNKEDHLIKFLSKKKFDLIYANTAVTLPFAIKIKESNKSLKIINHVHELDVIIDSRVPNFKDLINNVDYFIAVSKKVKSSLVDSYEIAKDKISVIYEFSKVGKSDFKVKNNPKSNNLIIGGSGSQPWRKGLDLFIQTANYLNTYYPNKNIIFHWVGYLSKEEEIIFKRDIKMSNLVEKFIFKGELEEAQSVYKDFDIFLMTSREDPFPLVCIENGILGKPIICFKGATGTEEILKDGGGKVVPYLDVRALSEAIMEYYENRKKLAYDSEKARNLFSKFTPENICPEIFSLISKF